MQYHALALRSNGTVVGWGYNNAGQTTIPAGLTNVTAIAAGGDHSLALRSNGTVVGWGYNYYGETNVPAGLTNVTAIAAGGYYSMALKRDGTVVAWGNNAYGQTNIPAGLTNVTAIAAGWGHSLALKSDGTVIAWGYNNHYQTNVPPLTNVTAIVAGYYHSLALTSDGKVSGWGDVTYGQITIPAWLTDALALAPGCMADHALAICHPALAPVLSVNGMILGNGGALTNLNAEGLIGYIPLRNLPTGPSGLVTNYEWGVNLGGGTFSIGLFTGMAMLSGSFISTNTLTMIDYNASGFLYPSYPALGNGISLGYNYYCDGSGNGHFANAATATSRLTTGDGFIVLAIGAADTAPTTQRLVATNTGVTVYGTFNNSSDRNGKQDFRPVNAAQMLDRVMRLPVSEWSYKEDPATRHVGPVAQDFHATFQIGTDDKHIAPIDEGGVALAAIQGLNQKLEEQKAENAELKAQLAELKALVQKLAQSK